MAELQQVALGLHRAARKHDPFIACSVASGECKSRKSLAGRHPEGLPWCNNVAFSQQNSHAAIRMHLLSGIRQR